MNDDTVRERMEMVSSFADGYRDMTYNDNLRRIGLSEEDLLNGGPFPPLEFLLRYHGFARAGGEQAGYGEIAHSAFDELELTAGDDVPPTELWERFKRGCEEEGKGINQQNNEGVITGLAELTNREGNLFVWIRDSVDGPCNLKHLYLELNDIKGIGHKVAAVILRDAVDLWDMETLVAAHNRRYLQPVDKWVRRVSVALWPELEGKGREEIARELADECEKHDVSNIEFNQGAYFLGAQKLDGDDSELEAVIREGFDR